MMMMAYIDPDNYLLNSLYAIVSKYFIEDQLLCKINKSGFSCNLKPLHANIRVFLTLRNLKGNGTVQIHFNFSYKLRIIFYTVRFAYRKMKEATKIGCFH